MLLAPRWRERKMLHGVANIERRDGSRFRDAGFRTLHYEIYKVTWRRNTTSYAPAGALKTRKTRKNRPWSLPRHRYVLARWSPGRKGATRDNGRKCTTQSSTTRPNRQSDNLLLVTLSSLVNSIKNYYRSISCVLVQLPRRSR